MNRVIMRSAAVAGLSVSFLFFAAVPVTAQSLWTQQDRETAVWLEVLRPEFAGEADELDFVSSAVFLSGRWKIDPRWDLFVELPLAYGEPDGPNPGDLSITSVGNPYVGLEYGIPGSPVTFEFGARAPVTSDPFENVGASVGVAADFAERTEAFLDDYVPVIGRVNYAYRDAATGLAVRLRGGTAVWVPVDDGVEAELLTSYGTRAGYEGRRFAVGGVFAGRALLTEKGTSFGERTVHQVGVAADASFGRLRTGVHFRRPLDDELEESVDYVFGVTLGWQIR